jgi:dihydrofolate reductase
MTDGKVLWHLTMSLDGFIAGPNHSMDWMAGLEFRPGIVDEAVATTGAILAGRRGFDIGVDEYGDDAARQAYGGRWSGPIFVLTHHPDDAPAVPGITLLNCDVEEAVETGLTAAGGKNLEVFGADVARQCVTRGLIDEFYVHLAPVMLGDGVRLFDCPGIEPVRWERIDDGHPAQVVDLRYRPAG